MKHAKRDAKKRWFHDLTFPSLPVTWGLMATMALKILAGLVFLLIGLQVAAGARTITRQVLRRKIVRDEADGSARDQKSQGGLTLVAHTAGSIVYWSVLFLVVLIMMGTLGVEVTGVIAIAGTLGLAVGLALQGALSDVAAGLILGATGRYGMGDLVTTNGVTGTVVSFSLLTTVILQSDTKAPVTLPNSKVYGDVLVSLASQWDNPLRAAHIQLTVANNNNNLGPALRAVKAAVEAMPGVLEHPPVVVGVERVSARGTGVDIRFSLHQDDVRIKDNVVFIDTVTTMARATLVEQGVRLVNFGGAGAFE